MSSSKCNSCSQLDTFGFRSRDTINVDNPKGCTCVISEKDVILDFLMLMQSNKLLLDLAHKKIKSTPHDIDPYDITGSQPVNKCVTYTILTRTQIQAALLKIPYHEIVKGLENTEEVHKISKYVLDTTRELYRDSSEINPWEYLDVGCGTGRVSREIAATLEVMTQHTDIKDNRIGKYSHKEYEDFMIFDGVDLPYEDNMYLVVTCLTVLHHAEDPSGLIKSIYRVLKPGGILIMREFDCRSWNQSYSLDFMHQLLSEGLEEDMSVVNYRSRDGWRKLITKSCSLRLLKDKYLTLPKGCPYHRYFDVFQKPLKTKSSKKGK